MEDNTCENHNRIKISDFVTKELEMLRVECNFTEEEMEFFNMRAKGDTIENISETMCISICKANILSKKVKTKINKVLY